MEIIRSDKPRPRKPSEDCSTTSGRAMPKNQVNELFLHLSLIYGRLWDSSMDDPDIAELKTRQWSRLLPVLTPEQLDRAIKRCVVDHPDYPPGIGQFLKLCQPDNAELGIPDARVAYNNMIYGKWTHPAIQEACECAGGRYMLRRMSEDHAFRQFNAAYQGVIKKMKQESVLLIEDEGAA